MIEVESETNSITLTVEDQLIESVSPSKSSLSVSSSEQADSQSSLEFNPSSLEMDADSFRRPESQPPNPTLLAYRIVGDNIDKNVKPRNMTSEHQVRSLYYFHSYAVRDRIDLSEYCSDPKVPNLAEMNFEQLRPSHDDTTVVKTNFATLIGCLLKKRMPYFAKFPAHTDQHIRHEFYEQMCTKSKVVS